MAMSKFLVTYHGAGAPSTEAEKHQAMSAFMAWVKDVGDALVDPGAPLGPSAVVSTAGVVASSESGAASGYSILEADNLAAATELVRVIPLWDAADPCR